MAVEAIAIEVVTRKECHAWIARDEAREMTQSRHEVSVLQCAECKAEFSSPRGEAFRKLRAHYDGIHSYHPVRQVLSFEEASEMDATLRSFGYTLYRETKDKRRYNGPGGKSSPLAASRSTGPQGGSPSRPGPQ